MWVDAYQVPRPRTGVFFLFLQLKQKRRGDKKLLKYQSKSSGFHLSVKSDSRLLLSALPYYMTGLGNSRYFVVPSEVKQQRSWLAVTCFLVLRISRMKLFRVLIGSLDCLCPLLLTRVIILVLVLRHSIEKRSKDNFNCLNSPIKGYVSQLMDE